MNNGGLKNLFRPNHKKTPVALAQQADIKAPHDPSEKNCTKNIAHS